MLIPSSENQMQTLRFCKARFFHAQISLQAGLGKIMHEKTHMLRMRVYKFR